MKIRKKKQLEMILENVPCHPNPKVELEQYSTPSSIAADLIWNAYGLGDIKDLSVLDLGCGTGIFAIGSWIMGSAYSLGIDIDQESIDLGQKTIIDLIGLNQLSDIDESNINFMLGDVNQYYSLSSLLNDNLNQSNPQYEKLMEYYNGHLDKSTMKFGTLFQNPPFGSQERGMRHADRKFMEFAMNSADVIYSFHMKNTEEFVIDFYNDLGGDVSHKFVYKFPIPKIYDFHKRESQDVKVVVLRVENFK